MRRILYSLLLATTAAAAPAIAQPDEREERAAEREQRRSERSQAREARSEAREARTEKREAQSDPRAVQPEPQAERARAREARSGAQEAGSEAREARSQARESRIQQRSNIEQGNRAAVIERRQDRDAAAEQRRQVRENAADQRQVRENAAGQRQVARDQLDQQRQVAREQRLLEQQLRQESRERFAERVRQGRPLPPPPGARPDRPAPPPPTVSNGTQSSHWSTTHWRGDDRYDWRRWRDRNRSLFRLGFYFDPFGWGYYRWGIGWRLWPAYYHSYYWLNDPWMYRLPYAPWPYRWVRYYNDAILVNVYTGQVVDVIYGFFW